MNVKIKKPTLLLHVCCAPCFTSVFEQLKDDFDVTIFWFNPNIYPQTEYAKRLIEVNRYAETVGVKVVNIEDFKNESYSWNQLTKEFSGEPEGGKRCELCIKYRLLNTAKFAKENGFDYFATTLTVSPHKNSKIINEIGEEIERKTTINCHPELVSGSHDNDSGSQIKSGMTINEGYFSKNKLKFLNQDFKKNDGYKKSIDLCKEFNIYRQKYCGCGFSIRQDTSYKKQ